MNTKTLFFFLIFLCLLVATGDTLWAQSDIYIPIPSATAGVPYTYGLLNAGGNLPNSTWHFQLTFGTPPNGLNVFIDPTTNAVYLKGTPSQAGEFNFAIEASTPSVIPNGSPVTYFVGIYDLIIAFPTGTVGVPYPNLNLWTFQGRPPFSWALGAASVLPAGLTVSPTGAITGTPTAAGTTNGVFIATDSLQMTAPLNFSITINPGAPPLAITTTSLPPATVGTNYSYTLAATGGTPPYHWGSILGTLPTWLALNTFSGVLTGIPPVAGLSSFTVVAGDSANHNLQANLTILANTAPFVVTTTSLPSGAIGRTYTASLIAIGGMPPYRWSLATGSTLPAGLTLNAAGTISGTPTAVGTTSSAFYVNDSFTGSIATPALSITINSALAITTTSLPAATVGTNYSYTLTASGGTPPYTWASVIGSLPAGITLDSNTGELKGIPTTSGTSSIGLRLQDRAIPITLVNTNLNITINAAPISLKITTTSLPTGTVGTAYGATLAATGGTPPYTWSITSGSLPAGLALNPSTGAITGTPNAVSAPLFGVQVIDSASPVHTTPSILNITINPAGSSPSITTTSLPAGTVGASYNAILAATGGTVPYTWSLASGSLPAGLVLNASTGAIAGTPTTVSAPSFMVRVADSASPTHAATATLSLTINAAGGGAPPSITTTSVSPGTVGTTYTQILTATGGTTPYTWSLSAGSTLPAGLTLNPTGVITGTPTAPGTSSVSVQVTDAAGIPATANLTIAILSVGVTIGPSGSLASAQQPPVTVTLANPATAPTSGTLTLTFVSAVGGDDQMIRFSNGMRIVDFTVPTGSTQASFDTGAISVITGTVAGTITITATLTSGGLDVTPKPAPTATISINQGVPVISKVTVVRMTGGFTIFVTGYSSLRSMNSAHVSFGAPVNTTLTQPDVTLDVNGVFANWYSSAGSNAFGSQFTLSIPFTYQGTTFPVASFTVEMISSLGTSGKSAPVSP